MIRQFYCRCFYKCTYHVNSGSQPPGSKLRGNPGAPAGAVYYGIICYSLSLILAVTATVLFPLVCCRYPKKFNMALGVMITCALLYLHLLILLILMCLWYEYWEDKCKIPKGPFAMTILAFIFANFTVLCAVFLLLIAAGICC